MTVTWIDHRRFRVGDSDFACSFAESTVDRFCVRKPRPLVEATIALLREFPAARIVELGIASGGSTALIVLAARPKRLVAIEMNDTPVEALHTLIDKQQLFETVRPFYGFDQSDRPRLTALMRQEFGDERLDVVIDDASHRLEETRDSFEILFPRLRVGGLYVIEDWNWQLRIRYALGAPNGAAPEPATDPNAPVDPKTMLDPKTMADPKTVAATEMLDEAGAEGAADFQEYLRENFDRPALETLALQLVIARACSGEAIDDVYIGESWIVVRRGPGDLDAATFRVADTYVSPPGGFVL